MAASYYHILNIPENASEEDIRKAYRRKAKEFHPDVNKSPDAHSRFVMLTKAYETLIDKNKRFYYHQRGQRAYDPLMHYNEWVKMQKAKAEYEARLRYQEFLKNREKFRNSFMYYPALAFIYIATMVCYLLGTGVIGICSFLIYDIHFMMIFCLSPFICAGIFFIKWTGDWYRETKRYF